MLVLEKIFTHQELLALDDAVPSLSSVMRPAQRGPGRREKNSNEEEGDEEEMTAVIDKDNGLLTALNGDKGGGSLQQ